MKIYNKLVIDMTTGYVLAEDSFEHDGPVAWLCGATPGTGIRRLSGFSQLLRPDCGSWAKPAGLQSCRSKCDELTGHH